MNKTIEENFSLNRTVVLVGMMGCGKSEIGYRLARMLGPRIRFVDADKEIEAKAGMTIPEIFTQHGEAAFRASERATIAQFLQDKEPFILSVGGGAFMDAETRECIKQAGAASVWLKVARDILFNRVKNKKNRPLLQTENPQESFFALLAAREVFYAEAEITIECGTSLPRDTAKNVMQMLEQKRVLTLQIP